MRHVLSRMGEERPVVIDALTADPERRVPFATSDGRFELPPEVQGRVDTGYVVVALTDEDAQAAIALGYTPVVSLDPCEVS